MEIAPCNCLCVQGKAILRPTCDLIVDEYRPIATLPPATEDECPCRVRAKNKKFREILFIRMEKY